MKNIRKYGDLQIKQHVKVKYLGYFSNETMSGKAMALNIVNKINNKLQFFHYKIILNTRIYAYLCNALIHTHFNYA